MKIAIYTAIIGEYEVPKDPLFKDEGVDYFLFTDQRVGSSVWNVKYVSHIGLTPRKTARSIKILSHEYLPDYDITIWVDANFCQKKSIKPLIELMFDDVLILNHPSRDCLYDEATTCVRDGHDYKEIIEAQTVFYQRQGYPTKNGLVATGLILRKKTEKVKLLCEDWWHEVLSKSGRDQISFDYVAWINEICIQKTDFNVLHEFFEHTKHKNQRKKYE
jgi:uncharacterized membrane protein